MKLTVDHITQACVGAIRTFVEASYKEDSLLRSQDQTSRSRATLNTQRSTAARSAVKRSSRSGRTGSSGAPLRRVQSEPRNAEYDADSEEEEEDILAEYGQVGFNLIQLFNHCSAWECWTNNRFELFICGIRTCSLFLTHFTHYC